MVRGRGDVGTGRLVVSHLDVDVAGSPAVRDLSLTAEPGAVTGLLGPAAAGKSAVVAAVLGLRPPSAGSATVDGVAVPDLPRPGRVVGAVLARPGAHPRRTLRAHLRIAAAASGLPGARVDDVLGLAGLGHVAAQRATGQPPAVLARLAVATALLADPPVLVLDEPATHLDPDGMAWLRALLRRRAAAGATTLLASRSPEQLVGPDDPVTVLVAGRCVHSGRLADLAGGARVLLATADPAGLAHALVRAGVPDVVLRPDGRLAVAGTTPAMVAELARAAGIPAPDVTVEPADPRGAYLRLVAGPGPGAAW